MTGQTHAVSWAGFAALQPGIKQSNGGMLHQIAILQIVPLEDAKEIGGEKFVVG